MFAVDAFLSPFGDLSIEITNGGESHANLVSDGSDFYVDANNNLTHDPFELRGAIDQIKSISVDSPDAVGTLLWKGDFNGAPLSAFQSIDVRSIESVQLNANFSSFGSMSISVSHNVVFNSEANIGGNLSIQVGPLGNISDTNGALVVVLGDATLMSHSDLTLSDSVSNSWIVVGHTKLESAGSIDIGSLGTFGVDQLSLQATDATINELNGVVLRELLISGDLELNANTSVEDSAGSSIQVAGNLSIRSGTISLANHATDLLSVGGHGDFVATNGQLSIGDAGMVMLGSLAASGANVTVFEDDSMLLQSIAATGNAQLSSASAIGDDLHSIISVQGHLFVAGTSVTLADNATDSMSVVGEAQFIATAGDVNLGPAGNVSLGSFSATGINITLQEDDSTSLMLIAASGNLGVNSALTISDQPSASIRVAGSASLTGTAIVLADNVGDVFSVGSLATFRATARDVTITEAGMVTLGSLAASGANVTAFEDDGMLIQSIAATGNAQLSSAAAIGDDLHANISIQGNLVATGTSVTLADNATDVMSVVGNAQFMATAGDVNLGPAGNVSLGSFSATGIDITLQEDDSTSLMLIAASGNLGVNSALTISYQPSASIRVVGSASLTGTAIVLADNVGDVFSVGSLASFTATAGDVTITGAGMVTLGSLAASGANVTVFEDDGMLLHSIAATGNAQLTSAAAIGDTLHSIIFVQGNLVATGSSVTLSDNATDSMSVTGDAHFISTAGDVNLGPAGNVTLGSFSASAVNIVLQEDDSTLLGIVEAVESLETTSAMDIGTSASARIEALRWNAHANGSIRIADSFASSIAIVNETFFRATRDVVIEQPADVQFGSIGFLAGDVYLSEDSPTQLDGSVTRSLVVESVRWISQSGMDTGSGVRVLHVAGDARFDLSADPGEVYLLRNSASQSNSLADGPLSNNRMDGVVSVSGILGNMELRNVSPTATVGTLAGSFNHFSLWHPNANVVLLGDIHVNGDMDVIAGIESSDTSLGTKNPVDIVSSPMAGVQDRGSLFVQGNLRLTAAGDIRLSDATNESIRVVGSTSLISFHAGQLVFGTDGMAQSAGISAYSVDAVGNRGDLVASLDTSTVWETPQIALPDGRFLPSLLGNLNLQVGGDLEDSFQASIALTGDLDLTVIGSVQWADQLSNSLHVAGNSQIQSIGSDVVLGSEGVVFTGDIRIEALRGAIHVGGIGWTQLGIVELFANSIILSEDEALMIRTAIADDSLELSSRQSIVNLAPYDDVNREGVSASRGSFSAGSHLFLGQVSIDELSAIAHANGSLPETLLFQLNAVADTVGQRFFDIFGSNLPPEIQTNTELINGTTLSTTINEASFIQKFERDYGIYVTNLGSLQINSVLTDGDGVRVYVETLNRQNLQIAGSVSLASTTTDIGGIILVAGGEMDILGSGELRIQQSSQPLATQRIVRDEHFSIRAFDGGDGVPEYRSTRDILYASDAFADSGIQNVLQRIALQYGNRGEAGFENWIQYADGQIQNFDDSSQLFASQIDSTPQISRSGPLRAMDPATSDIAVVERSIPFEDSFLGSFQTLPTLAVFRRDFAFFLFEEGGRVDLAASTEQSLAFDPVDEVFSPGRKISLPLPSDIVVSRPILVASQPWVPNTESAISFATQEIQSSPLGQAMFEIAIYEIGFEDANANGQPDDSELPLRERVYFPDDESTLETMEKAEAETRDSAGSKHGKVVEETKDLKGVAAATTEQLDKWVDEYQKDPFKRSGAYAIISKDSITGVEVLKVFSIRDTEADVPGETINQGTLDPNKSSQESEINRSLNDVPVPPPVKPANRDDLSLVAPTEGGEATGLVGGDMVYAGCGVAMVSVSLLNGNIASQPSFRRCARRMRNGVAT